VRLQLVGSGVQPTATMEAATDGSAILKIEFPKGDFLPPENDEPVLGPPTTMKASSSPTPARRRRPPARLAVRTGDIDAPTDKRAHLAMRAPSRHRHRASGWRRSDQGRLRLPRRRRSPLLRRGRRGLVVPTRRGRRRSRTGFRVASAEWQGSREHEIRQQASGAFHIQIHECQAR
jgi:hypothetical protein